MQNDNYPESSYWAVKLIANHITNNMVQKYNGHYEYSSKIVDGWDSSAIGVYYCGYVNSNSVLVTHYVGKGTGDGGVRKRLQDHLREDYWPDVTHFGFKLCDSAREAEVHEADEIVRLQPKYNKIGK